MKKALALTGLASLLLVACGGGDAKESTTTDTAVTTPTGDTAAEASQTTPTNGPKVIPAPAGSLAGQPMILGSDAAPLEMLEFASVTCPGCKAYHAYAFPFVKDMLVNTGRVSFEYREFPTNPQNLSYAGSYLARCTATEKGSTAYFKILKTLFERQSEWVYGPTPGEVLGNIAAQAGIDREGLENCFYREEIKAAVTENVKSGIALQVNSTPSFFVDGEVMEWKGSAISMVYTLEKMLFDKGEPGIPAGTETSIALPFDYCGEIVKITKKALGGKVDIQTETDAMKIARITSPDGGALVATCTSFENGADPSKDMFSLMKLGAN